MAEQVQEIPQEQMQPEANSVCKKPCCQPKTVLLVILGLIIMAGIALGAYTFGKKQAIPGTQISSTPTSVPTAVPTVDETANWKTYTSSEYKFFFKYPSQLDHQLTNSELDTYNNEYGKKYGTTKIFSIYSEKEVLNEQNLPTKFKPWDLSGVIKKQDVGKSVDQILEGLKDPDSGESMFNYEVRMKDVDKKKIVRYKHCEQSCGEIAIIPIKDEYLEFELYTVADIGIGEGKEIFDQILSTFRFD